MSELDLPRRDLMNGLSGAVAPESAARAIAADGKPRTISIVNAIQPGWDS